MKKLSLFQIILLGSFLFLAIIGIITLALYKPGNKTTMSFVVWGELESHVVNDYFRSIESENETVTFTYEYIQSDQFDQALVDAISKNKGPDLVLMKSSRLAYHKGRLFPVQKKNFDNEVLKKDLVYGAYDMYVNEATLLGVPVASDPLVLYVNEPLLRDAGIVSAPQYWDEVTSIIPSITKISNEIPEQSGIALGWYQNITHAKDIIAQLMLQVGSPITKYSGSKLRESIEGSQSLNPLLLALSFYLDFGNQDKNVYTWSQTSDESLVQFANGSLVLYIGKSSDYAKIIQKNPNAVISLYPVPQIKNNPQVVFADYYALSPLQSSRQKNNFQSIISTLLSSLHTKKLLEGKGFGPVLKNDVLAWRKQGGEKKVLADASFVSKSWFDPHVETTQGLFKDMIEHVQNGKYTLGESVREFKRSLRNTINTFDR